MLLMEKMLPHLGFVQPSSFHMLSQLARPVPVPLGQHPIPGLAGITPQHLKLCGPLGPREHHLTLSVLGRAGNLLERSDPQHLQQFDRDDDKGNIKLDRNACNYKIN